MKTLPRNDEEIEEFYIFADELAYQWKRNFSRHTERELVEIFSPPKEMIIEKLKDVKENQAIVTEKIKQALKQIYTAETDEFSRWFGEQVVKLYLLPKLNECNQHRARLKRTLNILTPKATRNTGQEEIEKARHYPISEIARHRLSLRSYGDKFSSLCPFHEEKHASFYIYPETNSFHCFGCQESGDIIKLTMHLYSASFREAIQMLQ